MIKLQSFTTLSCLLLSAANLNASNARTRLQRVIRQIDNQSEIDKRELRWKIAWICRAHKNEAHPLSTTLVYRWEKEQLVPVGDIADLTDKDLVSIKLGNFVDTEYITQIKTRLSNETCVYVGAIIVGTHDETLITKLQRLLIKSKI